MQQEAEAAFKFDPWSQGGIQSFSNFRIKAGMKFS
jgi:hypothetical protein